MCGRFTLHTPYDVLGEHFGIADLPETVASYNIAPSQTIAAVRIAEQHRELVQLRWGLLPGWAKDAKTSYRMINARAETVAEKPAYRTAFRRRRCLVPADGFYEWRQTARRQAALLHPHARPRGCSPLPGCGSTGKAMTG